MKFGKLFFKGEKMLVNKLASNRMAGEEKDES
jgi:uncharacterized protein (DUF433 family)